MALHLHISFDASVFNIISYQNLYIDAVVGKRFNGKMLCSSKSFEVRQGTTFNGKGLCSNKSFEVRQGTIFNGKELCSSKSLEVRQGTIFNGKELYSSKSIEVRQGDHFLAIFILTPSMVRGSMGKVYLQMKVVRETTVNIFLEVLIVRVTTVNDIFCQNSDSPRYDSECMRKWNVPHDYVKLRGETP